MSKSPKAGAATRSFANLLGLPGKPSMGKPKAEGDPPKEPEKPEKDDGKNDEKEAKGPLAQQEPDTEDDGKAQCAVCEGTGADEDGDKCEACDGTGEVGDGDETVRDPGAAKADDEDDATKARKAERTRWARVMSHPGTGGARAAVACHLLSTTEMKSPAVIAALADVPMGQTTTASGARESLYSRMGADRTPNPGAGDGRRKPAGDDFAEQMKAAVGLVRAPKK